MLLYVTYTLYTHTHIHTRNKSSIRRRPQIPKKERKKEKENSMEHKKANRNKSIDLFTQERNEMRFVMLLRRLSQLFCTRRKNKQSLASPPPSCHCCLLSHGLYLLKQEHSHTQAADTFNFVQRILAKTNVSHKEIGL